VFQDILIDSWEAGKFALLLIIMLIFKVM